MMNGQNIEFTGGKFGTANNTPGVIFTPGESGLTSLNQGLLPSSFNDNDGLIIVGLQDFGKQVFERFVSLCSQYESGFDRRRTKLILVNPKSEFPDAVAFSTSVTTFRNNFSGQMNKYYREWGNLDSAYVIFLADLKSHNVAADSYEIFSSLPDQLSNCLVFLSYKENSLVDQNQKTALREFLHWQERGIHDPDDPKKNEFIKDIYLLDGNDDYASERMALALFTRFHKDVRTNHSFTRLAESQPIYSIDIKGCGIPVSQVIDDCALKISKEILLGETGIFPIKTFTQQSLNQIFSENKHGETQNQLDCANSVEDICNISAQYLNNKSIKDRWFNLYTAGLIEKQTKNNSRLDELINCLNRWMIFEGKPSICIESIKNSISTLDKRIAADIQKSTSDQVIRWNVEKRNLDLEIDELSKKINSNLNLSIIREQILERLQLNIGLNESKISILPVCVPARWEGILRTRDFQFGIPEQAEMFVEAVVRLVKELVITQMIALPSISTSLREADKQFLFGIEKHLFPKDIDIPDSEVHLLIASNDQRGIESEEVFAPGCDSGEIRWKESNLLVTYIQKNFQKTELTKYLQANQSGRPNYVDPHLVLAENLASKFRDVNFNCPSEWFFCDKTILSLFDPKAVSIFWKGLDRKLILWDKEEGHWFIPAIANYSKTVLADKSQKDKGLPLISDTKSRKKGLASLAEAFYNFTIIIPGQMTSSSATLQRPMHIKNRKDYFNVLISTIKSRPREDEMREWLKQEYIKSEKLPASPDELAFIQDCYRLYLATRTVEF